MGRTRPALARARSISPLPLATLAGARHFTRHPAADNIRGVADKPSNAPDTTSPGSRTQHHPLPLPILAGGRHFTRPLGTSQA